MIMKTSKTAKKAAAKKAKSSVKQSMFKKQTVAPKSLKSKPQPTNEQRKGKVNMVSKKRPANAVLPVKSPMKTKKQPPIQNKVQAESEISLKSRKKTKQLLPIKKAEKEEDISMSDDENESDENSVESLEWTIDEDVDSDAADSNLSENDDSDEESVEEPVQMKAKPKTAQSPSKDEKKKLAKQTALEAINRTIFVGNLRGSVAKKLLMSHFSKYGKIEEITLKVKSIKQRGPEKAQQKPKEEFAEARIRFKSIDSAKQAIAQENGKLFNGLHLRVNSGDYGQLQLDDRKSIMVGNLNYSTNEEDLHKAFSPCGDIEMVRILRRMHTNVSRGFGYVVYKSKDSVQLALEMGDVTIKGRIVRVKPSEFSKHQQIAPKSDEKCIFVGNLDINTTQDTLKKAFNKFGNIEKVSIKKNRKTQKEIAFAFIQFETAKSAAAALVAKIAIEGRNVVINKAKGTLDVSSRLANKKKKKGMKQSPKSGVKIDNGDVKPSKKGMKPFQGTRTVSAARMTKKKLNKGAAMKKKMSLKLGPKVKKVD